MTTLGNKNEKIVLVNADLSGTCRNRNFALSFPNRFFNVGIAEQNMVSFAAGLSCEGFVPYVFTMASFLTMRACEQCRDDVAYGSRNVKMIGIYAGVSGGISGATHWAIEDIGIMNAIPGINIFEVCDQNQARNLLDYSLTIDKPMYIRVGIEPVDCIYPIDVKVTIGGSHLLRDGGDCFILTSGITVKYSLKAAEELEVRYGYKVGVIDLYSIKPIDIDAIIYACKSGRLLVVQDHNINGGLGSIVATIIVKSGLSVKYQVLGIPDVFSPSAHAPILYEKFYLDSKGITETILDLINN